MPEVVYHYAVRMLLTYVTFDNLLEVFCCILRVL